MRTKNSTAKQTENKIKMPLTLFQQEDESISHDPNRYLYVCLFTLWGTTESEKLCVLGSMY